MVDSVSAHTILMRPEIKSLLPAQLCCPPSVFYLPTVHVISLLPLELNVVSAQKQSVSGKVLHNAGEGYCASCPSLLLRHTARVAFRTSFGLLLTQKKQVQRDQAAMPRAHSQRGPTLYLYSFRSGSEPQRTQDTKRLASDHGRG